jgi:hypothetical protein
MPILDSETKRSAIRKALLAMGMGAIFGFQSWRLANVWPAVPIPWYGPAWMFFSQVLLGCSIGISGARPWWKRGAACGLGFSIPSVFGAHALGLAWAPSIAIPVTFSLCTGVLTALIADSVFPRPAVSTDPASPVREELRGGALSAKAELCPPKPVRKRLAKGKAALEHLEAERDRRGDPRFGQTTEDRIVWNELIELELQEIDEQVSRISRAAGQSPWAPSPSNLREGGSHERNGT